MSPFIVPIVMFITAGLAVILTPLARAYAKKLEHSSTQEIPSQVNQRLDRMEQAIDVIAEQVERVAEGQRFTTKLLTERNASEAAQRIAAQKPEFPGGSS
ncbi:MAG: hypothetical protein ABJB66_13690 [Gemmatimonadaceae bacterium]